MSLELRRAEASDLAALLALEASFPGDRLSVAALRRLLASQSSEVWVAQFGDLGVVGDAVLSTRRNSRMARVASLIADPRVRRRGVASALLQQLEARAAERGASRMRLEVRVDNHGAIAFYRRAGYQDVGVHPCYYDDDADALVMEKGLQLA